jgi:hypothetical protein
MPFLPELLSAQVLVLAAHVRGESGGLAAVRFYDVHPPLDRRTNGRRRLP